MKADIVITIGSMIFIIALLPSVFSAAKPAAATSLMTGTVLAVFAVTYTTLDLWFSAITTAITSTIWFVLLAQVVGPAVRRRLRAWRQQVSAEQASADKS